MVHFPHIAVAVAEPDDARATCAALDPYIEGTERVTAVHVIEKAGGAPDKAPLDKRREDASDTLGIVDAELSGSVSVDTRIVYGTDVVETIFSEASDAGADAIAFQARGNSLITRILTGNVTTDLVIDPLLPAISLPDPDSSSTVP